MTVLKTSLVVPIFITTATTASAAKDAIANAKSAGADMVELRCDQANRQAIDNSLAMANGLVMPAIVTIRPTWEGGGFSGTEDQRLTHFFHAALAHQPKYIDIELQAWRKSPAFRNRLTPLFASGSTSLILSSHDFTGRPSDLSYRLEVLEAVPEAAILKLVWNAESILDAFEALALYADHARRDPRPLLSLTMGPPGVISRLLAAKFEAPINFATLTPDAGSAPGQPSLAELKALYRSDKQSKATRVFGVAGWPVGHSISPAIHNAGFSAIKYNGVYVPLPVEPEYDHFAAAIDAAQACPGLNFSGLSVTIPHKHHALRYVLDRGGKVDPVSLHIKAINTIFFLPNGTLCGTNTDYAGALDALVIAMGIKRSALSGRRAAVLGAGGAARAIVAGLSACGVAVTIYNRNIQRAAELAQEFNCPTGPVNASPVETLYHSDHDIYINCTPVGMSPNHHASPVPENIAWNKNTLVFDTVYNPHETQMLQLAKAKGARVVHGVEMLIAQALLQFEGFTGQPAPEPAMRQAALAALDRR